MADEMTKVEPGTDLMTTFDQLEGVVQRPAALDPNDRRGTEDITAEELRLPRLCIAQGLSPQITPGDPQYIEGLRLFDMFNDLTGEIYGRGPLTFVAVKRDIRRIEFIPRAEGGGIKDLDVPANDPRLLWTIGPNGEKEPPLATTFVEFVILLLRGGRAPEPIVLSIKGTNKWNRRASDQLTAFIKLRNAPIFAGLYKIDTLQPAKNDQGTFGVPVCKNANFIPLDSPRGAALYKFAEQFHEAVKGVAIIVDREEGTEDETETFGAAQPSGVPDEVPF